jgi:hypothetical protein
MIKIIYNNKEYKTNSNFFVIGTLFWNTKSLETLGFERRKRYI